MPLQGDAALVQLVDAALADATQRSGRHLVCHAGCTPCCHGVFPISSLDAQRLRTGLSILRTHDPQRAIALQRRLELAQARLADGYPGDVATGRLHEDGASREAFETFADDDPCPVLDPASGTCDLYEHRPMTCRVFGPPVRSQDGLGICELCFQDATESEIATAEMYLPDAELEANLTEATGTWSTIVAFAFLPDEADASSLTA